MKSNLENQQLVFSTYRSLILVIATLASFGPVMRATRVRIDDTLRYE